MRPAVLVICEDNQIRHAPFDSSTEAEQWCEWGHICTRNHTIIECLVPEGPGERDTLLRFQIALSIAMVLIPKELQP